MSWNKEKTADTRDMQMNSDYIKLKEYHFYIEQVDLVT